MYKQVFFICAILLATMFLAFQPSVVSAAPAPEFFEPVYRLHSLGEINACDDFVFPSFTESWRQTPKPQNKTVVGVYACHLLALQVLQQPQNDSTFVYSDLGVATQFSLATNYGTVGLLAHNNRSGIHFFDLNLGDQITVVYSDGAMRQYLVSSIRHFQTLNPNDPYSDFNDLDSGGARLSSTEVFQQVYSAGDQVVFQTCIDANGNPSWGRLFVIAKPIRLY